MLSLSTTQTGVYSTGGNLTLYSLEANSYPQMIRSAEEGMVNYSISKNRLVQHDDGTIELIPHHPAYLFGKHVVRPLLEMTCRYATCSWSFIRSAASSLDQMISKLFPPFLFVSAEEKIVDGASMSFPIEPNQIEISGCQIKDTDQLRIEKNLLTEQDNLLGFPFFGTISHDQLSKQFEKLGMISRGGEAVVFKVQNNHNGKNYAMRIEYEMRRLTKYRSRSFFEELIKIQNNHSHLTQTLVVCLLEDRNYPLERGKKKGISPYEKLRAGEFIRTDYVDDPEATTYYREVTIMELGEGDLDSLEFRHIENDPLATLIQMKFSHYRLIEDGIIPRDEKTRNFIWKSVENEYYKGLPLKSFSYWHYQFGDYHLYLPRRNFIIKRVDFGLWELFQQDHCDDGSQWLKRIALEHGKTVDEILQSYPKPDIPESEILPMNDCC